MIRSGIACLAMIACASAARAELTIQELEPQPFTSEIADFSPLGQGDLFLRVRTDQRSVAYVLAADGKVKERAELPYESYRFVVPYLNGFAAGASEPVKIVAHAHITDSQPRVLYQSRAPFDSFRLYAAPDGQDLYVTEAGPQGTQLTRIDATGQIAWQKTIARMEPSTFVVTNDGALLVHAGAPQRPQRMLRAIDRDGRTRWETPFLDRGSEPIYSPAGFITLLATSDWEHGRGRHRVMNFDASTGQPTADVLLEPFAFATGTKAGLLIGGWMLGQAYVATLDRNGKYVWLRRYVPDYEVGDVRQGAMTRDGKLVFVTRERNSTSVTPATTVVVTDGTAASLAAARGGCLNPEWQEAVEVVRRLRALGLLVVPPNGAELKTGVPGCMERETRFIAFMKALAAAIPAGTVRPPQRQQMYVQLTARGEPIRLERYSVDYGGITGGSDTLGFAAPYDGARDLWKIISTQVQPHLDRMRQLRDRFMRMTGFLYGLQDRSPGSIDVILTELEKSALLVDQRIATIAPDTLAAIRRDDSAIPVGFTLSRDGFSGSNDMFSASVADRTFLDTVQRGREAAARGDRFLE